MSTLRVKLVKPYSPDSDCAEVTLCSDNGEILVFSHPYVVKAGDVVPNALYGIATKLMAAYLHDWPEEERIERSKERLEKIGPYAYRGCGRVVDRANGIIEVFGFQIEAGGVPCDGPIEFEFERIDL